MGKLGYELSRPSAGFVESPGCMLAPDGSAHTSCGGVTLHCIEGKCIHICCHCGKLT